MGEHALQLMMALEPQSGTFAFYSNNVCILFVKCVRQRQQSFAFICLLFDSVAHFLVCILLWGQNIGAVLILSGLGNLPY